MVKELKKIIFETKFKLPAIQSPGTHKWVGLDDAEAFENNLMSSARRTYLEQYLKKPIEYKINKQMLRCDYDLEEIGDKPVDLYLGCSHTFGSGHYKENTWPYLVSKYTGNIEVNLGVPGGDIEASYMRLLQFVRRLNVANVFHLQPPYYRYGYRTDNTHSTWIVWDDEKEMKDFYGQDYVWNNYLTDGAREYNYMKYLNLIRYECEKLNIPLYHSNIKNIEEEDTDYLLKENKAIANDMIASSADVLNDFVHEHWGSILKIRSTDDLRKGHGNGMDDLVIPESDPRIRLVGRYETDVKKLYIIPKVLKAWCGAQQINYSSLIQELKDRFKGKAMKIRLTKGTSTKMPLAHVLCIDCSEVDLEEDAET